MNDYFFLVNPKAGKGKAGKSYKIVEQFLRKSESSFKTHLSKSRQDTLETLSKESNNFKNLIVAGGDGTVNSTVNWLNRHEQKILALPVGSGNDFTSMLWKKKKLHEILEIHFNGNSRIIKSNHIKVNMIEEGGNEVNFMYINTLGVGFDSYVAKINQNQKTLSGLLSYIFAVFKGLSSFEKISASIKIDGKEMNLPKDQTIITIGNNKTSGGGFYLNPKAEIDDDLLDIATITRLDKLQIVKKLPYTLINKTERIPEFIEMSGKSVEISLSKPFIVHADGEIFSENAKKINISICKENLQFYGI